MKVSLIVNVLGSYQLPYLFWRHVIWLMAIKKHFGVTPGSYRGLKRQPEIDVIYASSLRDALRGSAQIWAESPA